MDQYLRCLEEYIYPFKFNLKKKPFDYALIGLMGDNFMSVSKAPMCCIQNIHLSN